MKRKKQLTKRELKAIHGPGPSTSSPDKAPRKSLRAASSRKAAPEWVLPIDGTEDPEVPVGARGELVEGEEAQEWVLDMLEIGASVMVGREGDEREPTLVCWLTPPEHALFEAAMPPSEKWGDTLFDDVTVALKVALPDEDVDARLRGHVVGVIAMEERMPRWQQLSAPDERCTSTTSRSATT